MVRHSPRMMSSWKKATKCTYIQRVLLISSEALRGRSLWVGDLGKPWLMLKN